MNNQKHISIIETALIELEKFAVDSEYYSVNKKPISGFIEVLELLKLEFQNNPMNINERVLRATRDASGIIAKQFEETSFEKSFYDVIDFLYDVIPDYNKLKPLGMDYKKGNPI
jgi:hypothetical protein